MLNHTIWATNFQTEAPEELHPSGFSQLDRLARRFREENAHGECLHIFLQHARERPANADFAKMAEQRNQIDQKRARDDQNPVPVRAAPDVPYTVQVYDPGAVGMSSVELIPALATPPGTALGYIPADFRAIRRTWQER